MRYAAKSFITAVAMVAFLSAPVAAGPFEDALAAYKRGDYATALRLWRPLADQGDAKAQSGLGGMYFMGDGVAQDDATAAAWWRKAAEQGYARAQTNLGVMYNKGRGVPKDYAEAIRWWRLAAEQGYTRAQYNLGRMYDKGDGVPQDHAEAVKWYRLAAEQGRACRCAIQPRQDVQHRPRRRATGPSYGAHVV